MRLHNLDYLRGLCATSIMGFHYLYWTLGSFGAESIFGRIRIYGVSIFYILSGLTLFYVYHKKMTPTFIHLKEFFIIRFFRIYPLLWVVMILTIIAAKSIPDARTLFLNFTGLFGLLDWDHYIGTGVWSIGNELVFYLFFPLFILLLNKSKLGLLLFSLLLLGIYVYFAFFKLNDTQLLDDQWHNYVNPLNQVFLLSGGFLMGYFAKNIVISHTLNTIIFLSGALLFVFYPAKGDAIQIVTGYSRLALTLACFMVCFGFYKMRFELPAFLHKPLSMLGEASYSVFLIHPLVFGFTGLLTAYISNHFFHLPETFRLLTSVILTLLIGYFGYQYFEKYFIKLGAKTRSEVK